MKVDEDTLIAYALGTLPADEAREVERYLQRRPEAAAEVRDYLDALTALALSEPPAPVPDDAEAKLLARIRGSSEAAPPNMVRLPPRHYVWWSGLAVAAALVLALWFGVVQPRYQDYRIAKELEAHCNRPGVSCHQLVGDGARLGTLARLPGNELFVVLETEPPEGRVYQAWEIVGGQPVSLGVWDERVMRIDRPLAEGSTFGVTLEPPGGSPRPTSTPIVLLPL